MFNLASLFVDISAKDDALRKSVGGLKSELTAMGVAIGTAAGNLAAGAIGRASSALTGFLSRGIAGASNLAETVSKVDAIFGEFGKDQVAGAEEMARAYGLPKQAILDASASIGLVGKASGQSQQQASQMAGTMAKLAADASSFYNVPLDVALEKIRSGLVGESEPLRAFGVLLSEDAVAAEAMAMGLAKSKKDLDEQAKVAARASLITKGLADAQGDLERTAGSTANQWRKFSGTLENTAVSIGTSLSPAISAVTTALGDMAQWVASSVEASKDSIRGWAESIAGAIRAVPDAWDTFVAGLAVAFLKVEEWSTNTQAVFATIPGNLRIIGEWIGNNWTKMIADAVSAAGTAFRNLGDNIYRLGESIVAFLKDPSKGFSFEWKPLLDGFKATADQLPEMLRPSLVSMDGAIAAVGEDLNRKITGRAKAAADAGKAATAPAKAAAQAAAKKTQDFKSETSSVSEFALKVRSAIYEGGGDDTLKRQLGALEDIRKTLQEMGAGTILAKMS